MSTKEKAPEVTAIVKPEEAVSGADVAKWYNLQKQLAQVKDEEMALRNKIFKGLFKDPVEGVNKFPLSDGWILNADRTINRKVLEDILTTMSPKLREAGINPEVLVKWEPELSITEYRKLTEDERKLFDQVLEIKDGSPQMKIVLPKRG